jgi:hypothetical protein
MRGKPPNKLGASKRRSKNMNKYFDTKTPHGLIEASFQVTSKEERRSLRSKIY